MSSLSSFHFAQPWWLLALLVPLLVWLWLRFTTSRTTSLRIERYAEPRLLPHLIRYAEPSREERGRRVRRWSIIWVLAVLAMAGPRWDFTDLQLFRPGTDLVILLDLSRSMEVRDVQPSRLARARQEIEDLLDMAPPLRIGLVAYATVSHVISPITEDRETIRRVLPEISTDMVRLQGSRLSSALRRAERLLAGESEDNNTHTLLLISDGDFAEPDLVAQVRALVDRGIRLHVLGVGTTDGARVPAPNGSWVRDRAGNPVVSQVNEDLLRSLAQAGKGLYLTADYRDYDSEAIIEQLLTEAPTAEQTAGDIRIWRENFYWLLTPAVLLLLPWFRRNRVPQSLRGGKH